MPRTLGWPGTTTATILPVPRSISTSTMCPTSAVNGFDNVPCREIGCPDQRDHPSALYGGGRPGNLVTACFGVSRRRRPRFGPKSFVISGSGLQRVYQEALSSTGTSDVDDSSTRRNPSPNYGTTALRPWSRHGLLNQVEVQSGGYIRTTSSLFPFPRTTCNAL